MIKRSPVYKFWVIKNEGRKIDCERDITWTSWIISCNNTESGPSCMYIHNHAKRSPKNYLTDGSINMLDDPNSHQFYYQNLIGRPVQFTFPFIEIYEVN